MDIRCIGCDQTPSEIPEYIESSKDEGMLPEEYIRKCEGTFNPISGHFVCTECYIDMGMPTAPFGWKAP